MKKEIEKAIDEFIDTSDEKKIEDSDVKKEIINERSGLIERIDKQYVTKDGRILLREQY